jgi:hypothetical protein
VPAVGNTLCLASERQRGLMVRGEHKNAGRMPALPNVA